MKIITAAPKGCSIVKLFNWFAVNHQGLVVGENVAAKEYIIPVINNPPKYYHKQSTLICDVKTFIIFINIVTLKK